MKIFAGFTFISVVFLLMVLASVEAGAQDYPEQPQTVSDSRPYTPAQLDQMLAPIALYPDPLLAQILMASTYPLQIVEADRWLRENDNAGLQGDDLSAALAQQPWDPSIKSLVPFPQILRMMDAHIGWTAELGDAFLADQAAVMDAVQRLRRLALANGTLTSSPQQLISDQDSIISIQPPNPQIVYVPVYDPDVVFGIWPYPNYPPYYFPGFFNMPVIGGVGVGWFGVVIYGPLWGWGHWNWHHHRIDIDRGRFNAIHHAWHSHTFQGMAPSRPRHQERRRRIFSPPCRKRKRGGTPSQARIPAVPGNTQHRSQPIRQAAPEVQDLPRPWRGAAPEVQDLPRPWRGAVETFQDLSRPSRAAAPGVRDLSRPCRTAAAIIRPFPWQGRTAAAIIRPFPWQGRTAATASQILPRPCRLIGSAGI